MSEFEIKIGDLSPEEQQVISNGFTRDSLTKSAPRYKKDRVNWLSHSSTGALNGALAAEILWDWLYVDELWVHEDFRGDGLGQRLMSEAEKHARNEKLTGIWLWTQSWQAAGFYNSLGYSEFTSFPDFPKGHSRIGFRKMLGTGQT